MDARTRFRLALAGFAAWVAVLGVLAFAYSRKPQAPTRPRPAAGAPGPR